jgi:hypothetical protein
VGAEFSAAFVHTRPIGSRWPLPAVCVCVLMSSRLQSSINPPIKGLQTCCSGCCLALVNLNLKKQGPLPIRSLNLSIQQHRLERFLKGRNGVLNSHGIAQALWRRAGRPGFDSRQGQQIFYVLHSVQTGSGAHPASYPMVTGGKGSGVKNDGAIPSLPHT